MPNIAEIDKNMDVKGVNDSENLIWYDPKEEPFTVSGFAFFKSEKRYKRTPESYDEILKEKAPGVSYLKDNTAGGQIRFKTTSKRICIAAKLDGVHNFDHMAATGQCGFDCYIAYPNEPYRFEGVTRFDRSKKEYVCELISGRDDSLKDIIINMPLYMGVFEVYIGLEKDAQILAPNEYVSKNPVIFYGTSITQGGCATRPGMAYTNILSRRLNQEIINLGFSGSGKGEPELAEIIAKIEHPSLIVLTYEANAGMAILDSLEPFIQIIRNTHKTVPILVISRIPVQTILHNDTQLAERIVMRDHQKKTVEKLAANGDENIYFYDGNTLLGEYYDECTVDTVHPTDLGFFLIAQTLEPIIKQIINNH